MTIKHAALSGARPVVRRCLGLRPGQDLVIFVDETTVERLARSLFKGEAYE